MEANRVPNWNMGDRMPCENNLIWLSYISTHQGLFQNRQWDFQIPSVTSEFSSLWMPLWFIIKTLLGSRHYYLQLSEVFKAEVDKHQGEERPPNTDRRKATQHRPGCWKMKSTLHYLSLSQLLWPCNHTMNGCWQMVQVDQRSTLTYPKTTWFLETARGEQRAQAAEGTQHGDTFPCQRALSDEQRQEWANGNSTEWESVVFSHPL